MDPCIPAAAPPCANPPRTRHDVSVFAGHRQYPPLLLHPPRPAGGADPRRRAAPRGPPLWPIRLGGHHPGRDRRRGRGGGCGWNQGEGARANTIGSLLLGVYDNDRLRYAGNVGTGFTEATLAGLLRQQSPLERETSPFGTPVPPRYARGAHWVEPRLVGEVAFTQWTADGSMRHPSWRGLRLDKSPGEVHREG